ncbi:uncharacterized protein PHALS_00772 [Plasmopara halstedii]|uniref:Uncharacterized protein n=1 Tax=Plasmopara halstedii TaxID=4781 RepID=A0A0P1ARX3_PLAHL|nr:uncharacterized protein PHALS_00772 [Plasmopara halstedii]CEG44404.1 hypothetical protein PHALS_00772 [Plasmopara halstedii]|eukprot:XP_024580773.1 hypothetical protein PHALS_00772 [Plasmopara halstedii]
MIQTHRTLESIAACSGITACLSEGETECSFLSKQCPPCVYALSGGDFSCYTRKETGKCPFSGTYAECDMAAIKSLNSGTSGTATTPSTEPRTTNTPVSESTLIPPSGTPASRNGNLKNTGQTDTKNNSFSTAIEATTGPPPATLDRLSPTETPATPPPDSDPIESPAAPSSSLDPPESPATPSSSLDPSESPATPEFDLNLDKSPVTPSAGSLDSNESLKNVPGEKVMVNSVKSSASAPTAGNMVLVGGAVALVAVVMVFVVRRSLTKKKLGASNGNTVSSGHNSAWSDRTLDTDASGRNIYATYEYKNDDKSKDITMLSDSQASSTFSSGFHGKPATDSRTTADFSNFGGNAKYYADYSVSSGPDHATANAAAGVGADAPLHFSNKSAHSNTKKNNNFVDVTGSSSSMRGSDLELRRAGQHPLTVSQLMPKAIREDQEEGSGTRRRPESKQYDAAQAPFYHLQTAKSAVSPHGSSQMFDVSTTSSMYDIVDPMTMRDVESRSTEMYAVDNQYPKFSFASSAASSGIYDGDWSEDESIDGSRVHEHVVEHMI